MNSQPTKRNDMQELVTILTGAYPFEDGQWIRTLRTDNFGSMSHEQRLDRVKRAEVHLDKPLHWRRRLDVVDVLARQGWADFYTAYLNLAARD